METKSVNKLQGGPPTSYKWGELTPISRVVALVTSLFSAIYRVITHSTYIPSRGAHLVGEVANHDTRYTWIPDGAGKNIPIITYKTV